MDLQLIYSGLEIAVKIGAVSYTTVSLAWCALLMFVINSMGRPMRLRDESSTTVTLGVAFHAVCWPYSMKTVYDRHKRRQENLARSKS